MVDIIVGTAIIAYIESIILTTISKEMTLVEALKAAGYEGSIGLAAGALLGGASAIPTDKDRAAKALADELMKGGLDIVTGGTDTHVMLVDLRPKGVKGNATEKALGRAHITCNKNGIPFDTEKPTITSGIRLGSPAGTTRGFADAEFRQIADWSVRVVDGLAANGEEGNTAVEAEVKAEVQALCDRFPIYPLL